MEVLLRPLGLALIVGIFYLLKRRGIFTAADGIYTTKLAADFTIPCTILCSFASYSRSLLMLELSSLFFLLSGMSTVLMGLVYRKKGRTEQEFAMLNVGYNIGSFALPIIQAFYGASGVLTACMADLGNSIMLNGGTYALTVSLTRRGDSASKGAFFKNLVRSLLRSPPFLAYLVLLPLLIFDWQMPSAVVTVLEPFANANSFVCMAMVGLSVAVNIRWADIRKVLPFLLRRTLYGLISAALLYFLLPFSQEVREVLALVCVAPLPGLVMISVRRSNGDCELSGLLISLSILLGMVEMVLLATVFYVT